MHEWSELTHKYIHMAQYTSVPVHARLDAEHVPPRYKKLVASIADQLLSGKPVDLYAIRYDKSAAPETIQLIDDIANEAAVHHGLEAVAKRIKEYAKADKASTMVSQLAAAVGLADVEAMAVLAQNIGNVVSGSDEDMDVITAREAMARGLETAVAESKEGEGIRTGWPTLDRFYRLTPGSLLTIGAATGTGKSTVITSWLWGMAQRGTPVGIISVEDSDKDFGVKMLAACAGIDPAAIWQMQLSAADIARVQNAINQSNVPLKFTWVRSRNLQAVLDRMDMMVRQCGVKVIAVDFLQAIIGPGKKEKREEIDASLEAMIAKAGMLNVGLVLASQLNIRPGLDKNTGKLPVPSLSSLKESGTIENRSQCVVLLSKEYENSTELNVKLAKVKRNVTGAEFKVRRAGGNGLLYEVAEDLAETPW